MADKPDIVRMSKHWRKMKRWMKAARTLDLQYSLSYTDQQVSNLPEKREEKVFMLAIEERGGPQTRYEAIPMGFISPEGEDEAEEHRI